MDLKDYLYVFAKPVSPGARKFHIHWDKKTLPNGDTEYYLPYWGDVLAVIRAIRGGEERGYFDKGAEMLLITRKEYDLLKAEFSVVLTHAGVAALSFNDEAGYEAMTLDEAIEKMPEWGVLVTDGRGVAHVVREEEDEDELETLLKGFEDENVKISLLNDFPPEIIINAKGGNGDVPIGLAVFGDETREILEDLVDNLWEIISETDDLVLGNNLWAICLKVKKHLAESLPF